MLGSLRSYALAAVLVIEFGHNELDAGYSLLNFFSRGSKFLGPVVLMYFMPDIPPTSSLVYLDMDWSIELPFLCFLLLSYSLVS